MTTDFRALCAELVKEFEGWVTYGDEIDMGHAQVLIDRTRAALADGPAVPEGREPAAVTEQPSDGEGPKDADLHAMAFSYSQPCYQFEYIPYARAVLARWGTPNLTEVRSSLGDGEAVEPEPKRPTVMEIIELAEEIEAAGLGQVDLVRAALARWGCND